MKKMGLLCAFGLVTACSSQAGSAVLGITDYQVIETATSLRIVGVDAEKNVVGQVELTLGEFYDADAAKTVFGRTMSIDVMGVKTHYQNAGTPDVQLPLFGSKLPGNYQIFVLDPNVSSVLAKWGIAFAPQGTESIDTTDDTGDRAYSLVCHYGFNPTCGEGLRSVRPCCEWTNGANTYEDVCCDTPDDAITRSCGGTADPNCANGTRSACGCNGAQGCTNCLTGNLYYPGTCNTNWTGSGCYFTASWQ